MNRHPDARRPRSHLAQPVLALLTATLAGVPGCVSPLARESQQELTRSISESIRREIRQAQTRPEPHLMTRDKPMSTLDLKDDVLDELSRMAGLGSYDPTEFQMSPDLLGEDQHVVGISLERAIRTAARNNLGVQFAQFAPAISQAQLVAAQSAFDWVFFTNLNYRDTNQPRTAPAIGGQAVGLGSDQRQVVDTTVGLRRQLISGGQVTLQQQLIYTDVETKNLATSPDPANQINLSLQLNQPLLRNAGSDTALAQVRLAANAERNAIAQLKAQLIQTVTDAERAYWALFQAHRDLLILQRLLNRGIQVRNIVEQRRDFDATQAQIADAAARVENRRADVLRAENNLRQASDQLKAIMNDPELTVGSEVLLVPVDEPLDEPIRYSLLDASLTALSKRPEIQQAILSIDDTSIRQEVAFNGRLPRLDLQTQVQFSALDNKADKAFRNITDGHFVDYLVGLVFEQPVGNRGPEAQYRQRRLERQQAASSYRNTVQQIMVDLKAAMRDVLTNYQLIAQTRQSRLANAENLRSLKVEIETTRGLDVNTLDLWLRRQDALATAERAESAALVNYATALARLHSAMGVALERNQIQFDVPDVQPGLETDAGRWLFTESTPFEQAPKPAVTDSEDQPSDERAQPGPQPTEAVEPAPPSPDQEPAAGPGEESIDPGADDGPSP